MQKTPAPFESTGLPLTAEQPRAARLNSAQLRQ